MLCLALIHHDQAYIYLITAKASAGRQPPTSMSRQTEIGFSKRVARNN
jgi:hypothetical protein